jgi:DNA invertase Pin-like site-specific DNA recombinase
LITRVEAFFEARASLEESADTVASLGKPDLAKLIRRAARRTKPGPIQELRFEHQWRPAGLMLHGSYNFRTSPLTLILPGLFCAKDMHESRERIMTTYGYARVSTDGQTLTAQEAQLQSAGCVKVYSEKASGAKTDRAALSKVMARLDQGDVLVVTRLDRLARSTRDLLNTLDAVTRKGAGFRSLADTWADTTTPHGRLLLTVLGGLAEFERDLIRARTGEGRARAKARGVHMGRPPKLNRHQQHEAISRRAAGESLSDIARSYGVSHTTIMRLTAAPAD